MTGSTAMRFPRGILFPLEYPRVAIEMTHLRLAQRLLRKAPKGDGHAVMVFPGFLASDRYNRPLCNYLESLGYAVTGWEQGRNTGPTQETIALMSANIRQLYKRSGRKITLVGHSLGGVYAREMARRFPDMVRQVITLASPISVSKTPGSTVGAIYHMLNPDASQMIEPEQLSAAPPVPTTTVFTRTDAVVSPRSALQRKGHERSENIEVLGSHIGLTMNASVWYLLAERLAQKPGQWQPFKRKGWQHVLYPSKPK